MRPSRPRFPLAPLAALLFAAIVLPARAADTTVYADALDANWENWSWSSSVDVSSASPVHAGSAAIAETYQAAWAGLYLHAKSPLTGFQYASLSFWINGRAGGQHVKAVLYDGSGAQAGAGQALTLAANTWQHVTIPMATLGSPAQIGGIVFQENSGAAASVFSVDDIVLVASSATPTPTPTPTPLPGPDLAVNAAVDRHPISPLIYGMNFTDEALAAELGLPVRRWGGNSTTRYNWQLDVSNHANDWYFENIPEDNNNIGALPNGSSVDKTVEQDRRTGTKTILTMPLIGWTPKNRVKQGGFSVAKYGAQQSTDPYLPDAGNGNHTNGTPITGNDPHDTSVEIGPQFVQDWIAHLVANYGDAAHGGVAFYNLDNEPALWNSTHRDVHPQPLSYDEELSRTLTYAAAIKAADPTAATLGPVEWGWPAYFYSALDQAPGGAWWNNPLDRNAHGGVPLIEWYLQQLHAYDLAHHQRLLDYVDIHYYPQADGVALSPPGNSAAEAVRFRSTRGLWDPTYVDESWIADTTRMIPRMKEWVANNYPGTKLAITEYNWGALGSLDGAMVQADVLGIFGREGLDLATLWAPPTTSQPGAFAFRMFLNYDGQHGKFGDESVSATSSDQGQLAIYAARRTADRALTVIVINKTYNELSAAISLANFAPAVTASLYRYGPSPTNAIAHLPDLNIRPNGFKTAFPPFSISLMIMAESPSAAKEWRGFR